jgi:hypothetical protein
MRGGMEQPTILSPNDVRLLLEEERAIFGSPLDPDDFDSHYK